MPDDTNSHSDLISGCAICQKCMVSGNLPPFPPAEECGDLRVYFLKDNFKANKKNQSELIVKPKITLYIPICVCFVNRHP